MLYTPKTLNQLKNTIKHLADQWGWDVNVPITLYNVSENATFIYGGNDSAAKDKRIIRAYRPFYHSDNEIISELRWMKSIEKENIVSIPHIIPLHDNASNFENRFLASSLIDNASWRFASFAYVEGTHPNINDNLTNWFQSLGEISAQLHLHAQNWQLPQAFARKSWTFDTMIGKNAYWGDWRNIPNLSAHDFAILQLCVDKLAKINKSLPRDNIHFGLIHGDLRLANLLVNNNTLSILDFDDCGFSWYATELANALSFIEDTPHLPTLIQNWFIGYGRIREISPLMIKMLPHLIMMRRIQLSAWLTSHNDSAPLQEISKNFHDVTVNLAKQFLAGEFIFKET